MDLKNKGFFDEEGLQKSNRFPKNRGFIISSDAFIGLTVLAFLILVSLSYVAQVNIDSWNNIDLINSARDLSTVLEKNLVFENAIKQQSSELIQQNINESLQSICFEARIYSSTDLNTPILGALKADCTKSFSELVSVERTIIVNDSNVSFYVAKMEAWYK